MKDRVLARTDPDYPPKLAEARDAPAVLFVRGRVPRGPLVAIVGTRNPTWEASAFASALAADLAAVGVPICSGGARGIDTAAHLGCVAGGAPTLVVAPSGLDRPYPSENASLFDLIAEHGGGVISALPPGTPATPLTFFQRNAMLVALAQVVVVVESAVRGGARNAVGHARRAGRPVLAVPGTPWNPRAAGCLLEIRNGASMVTSSKDVLRRLPEPFASLGNAPDHPAGSETCRRRPKKRKPKFVAPPSLSPEGHVVVSAVQNGAHHPDEVCSVTGLSVAQVQAMILTLTLEGILVSDPSGRLSLVRH